MVSAIASARTQLPPKITIASRQSALAMWQARHVQSRLRALCPDLAVEILGLTTEGDRRLAVPLASIGGKGLFVKELEEAMAAGRADLAVHSAKDVPVQLPQGFVLAAMLEREDPRDAFLSNRYRELRELPAGARVGTSSLRRRCQLSARYPRLRIEPLRGNVDTRVRKLDEGGCDAVILAAAGLKRLGIAHRIASLLAPEECLPAPGQGALGLECRSDRPELVALLARLNDAPTARCVTAERALSRALAGSCNVPLGAFAEIEGDRLRLRGFVGSPDGARAVSGERSGAAGDAEALGLALAEELKSRGAAEILAAIDRG
jgi:hydroxymethylbilane synthase